MTYETRKREREREREMVRNACEYLISLVVSYLGFLTALKII